LVTDPGTPVQVFNSVVETALRAIIVLEAFHPRALSLEELLRLDHMVVHTSDFGGGASLHVAVEGRQREVVVRRRLVEEALKLLVSGHLADIEVNAGGLAYRAGDEAPHFLDVLNAPYNQDLKDRAAWLARSLRDKPRSEIEAKPSDWASQFLTRETGESA
jgi:hypothetical protein